MQTDLVYWILFAHMPRWTTLKTNKLIVRIIHNQKITFEEFFSLSHDEWIEIFKLDNKEINDLEQARKELPNYSFLLEDMLSQGYELIPFNSSDYPKTLKDNLKLKFAPPLIYIKGNKSLLNDATIAIVGSRKAGHTSLEFTKNIAINATKEYKCVVSGGAKGVDQTALDESIKADGHSILVLPQGILTFSSGMKKYYKHIVEGNLLILSTFFPKAGWSVGLAMGRNKYIYGLSKEIYVAESDSKGGTWSGVLEGLKAERTIYIRNPNNDENNANDLLILKGGKAVNMGGDLIKTNQIDEISLDEKIKYAIKGMALTAKQIKEKINYDIDTRKFSIYLNELPFVKKEKKGSSNVFIYKNESTQLNLFGTS
ncbi:DNA-processing protein DprA [Sulfurimonas sp.]|uniref:DNA-processing protein DprA n=1 Tax=Sulfurimonas sp. TaxID=2022749 RepID=UPI0025E1D4CD|nr:DNA-processing protein DprA [Sulfurimonas sp.]